MPPLLNSLRPNKASQDTPPTSEELLRALCKHPALLWDVALQAPALLDEMAIYGPWEDIGVNGAVMWVRRSAHRIHGTGPIRRPVASVYITGPLERTPKDLWTIEVVEPNPAKGPYGKGQTLTEQVSQKEGALGACLLADILLSKLNIQYVPSKPESLLQSILLNPSS